MRSLYSKALALTLMAGAIGCGSDDKKNGANPDASVGGDASAPDAPGLPGGVAAIPLTALGGGYAAQLKLGGTAFSVIVDTGSTTTAVADASCTACGVSPTYSGAGGTDLHKTTSAQYGSGSWNGKVFEDGAVLGTRPSVALDFASITSQSMFFQPGNLYQGLMGFGPDAALTPNTTSYLTKSIAAGMKGQIAFQMCPDKGTMWLGGFDPNAATTAPAFTPYNAATPYYLVNVGGAGLGSTSVNGSDFGPTVVDTGTTQTLVPTAAFTALTNAIKGSSGYASVFGSQVLKEQAELTTTMSSAQIDQALPPLSITFAGGTAMSIPATRSYLLSEGGGKYAYMLGDSSSLTGGQKLSIVGNTLLGGMLVIFDVDQKKIGFAPQKGCAAPPTAEAEARPLVVRRPTLDPAVVQTLVQP